MNLKSTIAKAYLPSSLKLKGLLEMYSNLALFLHQELGNQNMDPEILRNACAEVGKASAETLKEELGLGSTFEDAVDSWIIGSKAMNVKISLQRKEKGNEVVFDHLYCPMWEHFKRKGSIPCEDVCFPAAEAMAKQICSTVEVVVLRKPDRNHTCIKALKRTE